MNWREQCFGPINERTVENAQIGLLATRYDLSSNSRLAKEIVRRINKELDKEELRHGIKRVRPGEMILRVARCDVILPICTATDIDRAISGESLSAIRADIVARCLKRYKEVFPEADIRRQERLFRVLMPGRGALPSKHPNHGINRPRSQRPFGAVTGDLVRELVKDAKRGQASKPSEFPQLMQQAETIQKLRYFLGEEAGIPPAVREPMILDLSRLRARFCPRISMIESGQMPHVAMHVESGRSLHRPTRFQPLAPVILSLLAPGEIKQLHTSKRQPYPDLMEFHGRRIARVMVEAYQQDGLLSHAELQWCFLMSNGKISRLLDWYQRKHHVILPCPGSVLDMGGMMTHKDIIVRLYLQGMTVLEISRQTYHAPRSVDAYLRAFDAVLILHLYGLSSELMARVLGRGVSLVEEYLQLIRDNLKDVGEMQQYLISRGVKVARGALGEGS